MQPVIGQPIAITGVLLYGMVVLFQLVNLPVEFNASARARTILLDQGIVTAEEDRVVAKVLNAAAMTYVAATITAIMHLLYYLWLISNRRH
jgi:Zn-dependent membrane protease YugP